MVKDKFVELRRLTFHYRDWGGRGTPLVLLHGLASQTHIFDLVGPLLANRQNDFRVVALDQRGHGESAKPDDGYDFATVTDDLRAFLNTLMIKGAIIVGHSWGGNVALAFAARYPKRCRALVLIDGGFLDIQADPAMTWAKTEKQLAPPKFDGTPVEQFRARVKDYVRNSGMRWNSAFGDIIISNFEILPDQTVRPHLSYEHHMKILRALWEQRPPHLYAQVKCPVLLLPALSQQAEQNHFNEMKRASVARAGESLVASETVWFKNTVHDIPLHRPRKLANVITRFAREHELLEPQSAQSL